MLGHGCPVCKASRGEREIARILSRHKIKFIKQKSFRDLKCRRALRFDFAVLDSSGGIQYLIEYDGIQHFRPVKMFGGNVAYMSTKERDKLKDNFCKRKGISLIRIPYTKFDEIETILTKELIN
jgi:very-short-patch-repair endonuclease